MVLNASLLHPATTALASAPAPIRSIAHRTFGRRGQPITRLMSPSDLGQLIKPFVFLDIFGGSGHMLKMMDSMPMHPHSGIATVTVITEGHLYFDDPESGKGILGYGGVEWMRASSGVWHGKEMTPNGPNPADKLKGFQLWMALPPDVENAKAESRYIEAKDMITVGPATVIVGEYQSKKSPVRASEGYTYLLVTLKPGETWTYTPPAQHSIAWLAISKGSLDYGVSGKTTLAEEEMVVFEKGQEPIKLTSSKTKTTTFVLGSAIPHPHPLHLGMYSVHTSAKALQLGERTIRELEEELGDLKYASGPVPVFRK